MKEVQVYVEYSSLALMKPFSYLCDHDSIAPFMRVHVDFNGRSVQGIVSEVTDVNPEHTHLKPVLEILDEQPVLNEELQQLARHIAWNTVSSLSAVVKAMLPPALKPRFAGQKIIYEEWALTGDASVSLTPKAAEIYAQLQLPMKASAFRAQAKHHARQLIDKGAVIIEKRSRQEDLVPPTEGHPADYALNEDQLQAIEGIWNSSEHVHLLHGVTGSGKTEVFMALARRTLDQNRQVLFLVPEIGLTPMMIRRISQRFGSNIAIYHSRLSAQQKYDQYMRVKKGEASIVIGTRSAVFMPFENLGLILMDEEHDASYKQNNTPRYHARDAAVFRAQYHHCKLVLASATPSLESYARACKNVYALSTLNKRVHHNVPAIEMINLQRETSTGGIADKLLEAMKQALAAKEQVILLLNRRGYLPAVRCSSCKEMILCPDCGVPMSYHKQGDVLSCHVCGLSWKFDHTCPSCQGHHFLSYSLGTEQLEEQLQALLPSAHIVRMDADSTRFKNGHEKILAEFEEKGDILIGTQMVAKGLDFSRVSLVGILNADTALMRFDYRAAELAYEMLEQAAGRSGRSARGGRVMIQTFDEDHYVMQCVKNHSYREFFYKEMKFRHLGGYPPYQFLCSLVFSHEDGAKALYNAIDAKEQLADFRVLGPVEITMRQKKKRCRLLVKSTDDEKLKKAIWKLAEWQQETRRQPALEINMHPVTLEE